MLAKKYYLCKLEMKKWSRILFPLAVMAITTAGAMDLSHSAVGSRKPVEISPAKDTVIYPMYAYRKFADTSAVVVDSSKEEYVEIYDSLASKLSPRDSLKALLDSSLWPKLDSIYLADSTARAKAKFEAWYNSLSKDERKSYDAEQKAKIKMARADSIREAKQKAQDIKDSILAEVPRILETYALPDSMHYKRIITWTVDQDFHKIDAAVPDTSYNYWYNDYPIFRNDVNATWLGISGSPAQYYDFFKRGDGEKVEFYKALEPWSYNPNTLPHYNTKNPYTELSYFGTLFAKDEKVSDNLHLFTTQNITPEFNFSLLFNRFGGEGMLKNEATINKTSVVQANYLGKKYTMHAGYIGNTLSLQENGGIVDNKWIRDTTVDSREIAVALNNAKSKVKKNTFFLDQQLRIPFNFINKIKARRDTNFVIDTLNLDRDITTAFIGHSSELSTYTRKYEDQIGENDVYGREFYRDVFNYNNTRTADSMRVMKLDNKFFIRLQPWSDEAIISKLDVGVGDYLLNYYNPDPNSTGNITQNNVYVYAGAEGQLRNNFYWDAKTRFVLLGHDAADFSVEANGRLQFFPFRRAKKSPLGLNLHFESNLVEPTFYEQNIYANHFNWNNDFGKVSTTIAQGDFDIPHWDLNFGVGYALLGNRLYYDASGIIRQHKAAMSVISANLSKKIKLGPLHLDNRALMQFSSNNEVLPLPTLALNLRYYIEFVVQKDASKTKDIMTMQIGANAFYNSKWNSPSWNPNLGVFYNQNERLYNNGPYFDIFVNVQWKRACIFLKYQNAGGGWPMKKFDFFSSDNRIVTTNGMDGFKIGIYWPFYAQPTGLPGPPPSND